VNASTHAHAQASRASALIGTYLRDARARASATQCHQREEATRTRAVARGGEHLQAYTVEQVAEMLHVGRDKVYYLLRTGQLRSIKIGKLRRITDQHVADFVASLEDPGDPAA
jgi:excisionase family DNA binding protein